MTDEKKTDVPGAALDDSVPTETPKLLQQDLGLDRRGPRTGALPQANLKDTTPYFSSPAKLQEASGEHPVPPELANTVISNTPSAPSPLDFAKTVASAANPVLAKLQADERAARERLLAERQLAERNAQQKAANERLVAERLAAGARPPVPSQSTGHPGVAAPRPAVLPPHLRDPSQLQTDPDRTVPPVASRPQLLRQPLASRPFPPPVAAPVEAKSTEVITDPMPREGVSATTVVQRTPKTDPMQQPDVLAAIERSVAAPIERTEVSRPAPPPVNRPLPPAPIERTEVSRPVPPGVVARVPMPLGTVPAAAEERTEISRTPLGIPPPPARAPTVSLRATVAPDLASTVRGPMLSSAPAAPAARAPNPPAPVPATPREPAGRVPSASNPFAPAAAIVRGPPGLVPAASNPFAPAAAIVRGPPGLVPSASNPSAPTAATPRGPPGLVPSASNSSAPAAATPRGPGLVPSASSPTPAARAPNPAAAPATTASTPRAPAPAFVPTAATPRAPAAPVEPPKPVPLGAQNPMFAPTAKSAAILDVRSPAAVEPTRSVPVVTPTPVSLADLTPVPPREAFIEPAAQQASAPSVTAPAPPPRPAMVVPPSFMDLPPAMEQPRKMGPDLATTQPGIPGPYSKPKLPPPEPAPLTRATPPDRPSKLLHADPASDGPSSTFPEGMAGSDQVLATPASLWRRTLSSLFDLAIIGGAVAGMLFLAVTLTSGKPVPHNLHGIDAFFFRLHPIAIPAAALTVLLAVLYTTMGAVLLGGRTFGRLLFGIRLVDSSGRSPGVIRSLFRSVFAIVSFALFLAGFWLGLFDRRGQTLHDKLTRTFVVRPV